MHDEAHARFLLGSEGHKRLEGLLFEQLFAVAAKQDIGSGWMVQSDNGQGETPQYWFKLVVDAGEVTSSDSALAQILSDAGCTVTLVHFSSIPGVFTGQEWCGQSFSLPLGDSLEDLLGGWGRALGPTTEVKHTDKSRRERAMPLLLAQPPEVLRRQLAARLLINCLLAPAFKRQPMDLDGCVQVDGRPRLVEFKRKYPAKGDYFGIDERPHGLLVKWLEARGFPLLHVIAVDPRWDKHASPIDLLEVREGELLDLVVWLGIELRTSTFEPHLLSTSGADSGMGGGRRQQHPIRVERFSELGQGRTPSRLPEFLANPSSASPPATVATLKAVRDRAAGLLRASP